MTALARSLRDGFLRLARGYGLVPLLLGLNLGLALLLAVPFAFLLEHDLARTGASSNMMYGFDPDWWSRWESRATGFASDFGPDLLGTGFAFRDLDLLLSGRVAGGLLASGSRPDLAILGLGALYLLLQTFLHGGLLAVFRAGGGWTVRGLVQACGFYFGRLFRVSLLALLAAGLVFALEAPLAAWLDGLASEAVSERTALALTLGRHAALLLALVLVHMLSSYAKVIVVSDERRSALLAFLSSAGFCARHLLAALCQYLVVAAIGLLLLWLFALLDPGVAVTGFRTQLAALALFEALLACQIALRLWLLSAQLALHREHGR